MDSKITRRVFVGAGIAAVAAVAAGSVGYLGHGGRESSQPAEQGGESGPKTSSGVSALPDGARIAPASRFAQALLIALCPSCLACLVEPVPVTEAPRGSKDGDSSLRVVSLAASDGTSRSSDDILADLLALKPDLVLDVGFFTSGQPRVARMETDGSSRLLSIDLDAGSVSQAVDEIVALLPGAVDQAAADELKHVDDLLTSKKLDVEEAERFSVYAGGGADGFTAFGTGSSEFHAIARALARPFDPDGERDADHAVEDTGAFDGNDGPDIVFLLYQAAGSSYADADEGALAWKKRTAGALGYVFPALVGGRIWMGSMSPLAQVTIGALWVCRILYPQALARVMERDFDQELSDFYQKLYGRLPEKDSLAGAVDDIIGARAPLSREKLLADKRDWERNRADASSSFENSIAKQQNPSQERLDEAEREAEAEREGGTPTRKGSS